MYRLSMLLAYSSVIILSGCSKSTEPETQKPNYFTNTGIGYPNWHDTGFPEGILPELSPSQKMNYKAKAFFYNVTPTDVLLRQILSQIPDGYTGDEIVPVLDVVYAPFVRGAYNLAPDLADPAKCWGGLQRLVSEDEVQGNVNFYQIQVWLNVREAPKGAKLYIDLGRISEDVIPNGKLDSEDKNANGLLDYGEDTGIDGLADNQETSNNGLIYPDPAGDNFAYPYSDANYSDINGTENNAVSSDYGKIPDTEDLDVNYYLDSRNDFYRFEIQLDSLDADKRYIVEKGRKGWFKVIIPVHFFKSVIGEPGIYVSILMRLWFSGVQSTIHLRFAELKFISQ